MINYIRSLFFNNWKTNGINFSIVLIGFVPLIIWSVNYLNYDLWYDEVYSLEHFALKSWTSTLFHYPFPNNHIFFNITSQFISRLFYLRDIFMVSDNVIVFRTFQLLISILSAFYSMLIIKHFLYKNASYLIYVVLFTIISFMNFSLQLRGYNMSSLFLVMLIFYSWKYIESYNRKLLFGILILTVLLLYTIPSNLYFVITFWILTLGYQFKIQKSVKNSPYLKVLVAISIGVVVSIILYLPILEDVIFNKYSQRKPEEIFQIVFSFWHVSIAFISKRYFLFLLIIPGFFFYFKKNQYANKRYLLGLIFIIIFPFALAFLHQKAPFQRVFSPLTPVFCIIITVLIYQCLDVLFKTLLKKQIAQILISIYCVTVFVYEMNENNIIVSESLTDKNIMTQNIYNNYYLGNFFKQDSTMRYLNSVYKNFPVIVYNQNDLPSTNLYLKKYNIQFESLNSIEEVKSKIEQNEYVYVLTSYKKNTLNSLSEFANIKVDVLTKKYSFTNILFCKKIDYDNNSEK